MVAQTPDKPDWTFAVTGSDLIDISLGRFVQHQAQYAHMHTRYPSHVSKVRGNRDKLHWTMPLAQHIMGKMTRVLSGHHL